MFITVGEKEYELSTKMIVGKKIEDKFKLPITQIFGKLGEALTDELVGILAIAAEKTKDTSFKDELYENWDYTDLFYAVQELTAKLMYSGTPEQIEAKIAKTPMPEEQKNVIREVLGIPNPPLTGDES